MVGVAGTDLLEKAAIAAQALTREAQKAAEVESKFKALKDIAPLAEELENLDMPAIPQRYAFTGNFGFRPALHTQADLICL